MYNINIYIYKKKKKKYQRGMTDTTHNSIFLTVHHYRISSTYTVLYTEYTVLYMQYDWNFALLPEIWQISPAFCQQKDTQCQATHLLCTIALCTDILTKTRRDKTHTGFWAFFLYNNCKYINYIFNTSYLLYFVIKVYF